MDTTYGNMQKGLARTNTNDEVLRRAREAVKEEVNRNKLDKMRKRNPPRLSDPPTELDIERMEQWHKRIRAEQFKHSKQLKTYKLSTYYLQRKLLTLGRLVREDQSNPATAATIDTNTLRPIDHGKKRVGRPRDKWLETTINEYWKEVVNNHRNRLCVDEFKWERDYHVEQVKRAIQRKKEIYVLLKD